MRVGIMTLGCDKNTVDSEHLAGFLEAAGCEVAAVEAWDAGQAFDAVVLTTCGFVLDAKRESIQWLIDLAESKRETGNPRRLYVAGCLSQRYIEDLSKEVSEVDGWAGVGQYDALARLILKEGASRKTSSPSNIVQSVPPAGRYKAPHRRRLDAKPYAFLKIADGCDYHCTFCAIPGMKGAYCSVPRTTLLREARALLDQGVRELDLVAQDITAYGKDRSADYALPDLLRDLAALDGDFWIRCLYCYPGGITRRLIEVMASEPKVVPYLDIPLQHLDPAVLRRMKRPAYALDAVKLVDNLRKSIPGIALRTTMMVGFPGESYQAHRRMLDGLRRLSFDWLGAFQYSPEEGTPAAFWPRQVGAAIREKRWHAVMQLQAEITEERNLARIGRRERVLLDEYDPDLGVWTGRGAHEAPEVDGCVHVAPAPRLTPGQFVDVTITGAEVYDVTAAVTL